MAGTPSNLYKKKQIACICTLCIYSHVCALARDHEPGEAAIALTARFEPSPCRLGSRLSLDHRQVAVSALRACSHARHERRRRGTRKTRTFLIQCRLIREAGVGEFQDRSISWGIGLKVNKRTKTFVCREGGFRVAGIRRRPKVEKERRRRAKVATNVEARLGE